MECGCYPIYPVCESNWVINCNFRLCGFPPFYEENNTKLFEMIKTCNYEFPSPFWDDVSDTAKDLIRSILVVDPSKRLTAEQILAHPWVYGEGTPVNVLENVKENMRQYNIKRKFKVRCKNLRLINLYREPLTWCWLRTDSKTSSRKSESE